MLTAIDETGTYIHLTNTSDPSLIQNYRKKKQFYCPQCKEQLLIKAGKVRIPHFSHFKKSNCQLSFSEAESERHLQGKLDLYKLFKHQKIQVSLETYIQEINQRPDLLITHKNKRYAIEFQCSPISTGMVLKRTKGYRSVGITPIWIYGGPSIQKRYNCMYRLSDFQLSLANYYSSNLVLLSYNPPTQTFQHLTEITKLSTGQFYANNSSIPLFKFPFPFQLKQTSVALDYTFWLQNKNKWMNHRIRYGNLVNDLFLKMVYEQGEHLSALPYICGLPTDYMEMFKSHPVEWQYYIYAVGLSRVKSGGKISLKYINKKIQHALHSELLTLQQLPLMDDGCWQQAVQAYFSLLVQLGYLQPISADLFIVKIDFVSEMKQIKQRRNDRKDLLLLKKEEMPITIFE